ncbi:MAG: AAA family ATPase [Propionibacteriaceae bacterium]|jgi:ATP-dependent Clp protease ATP-binding subunit ClpE|nr:AAA family ATPase [Propionibacteriaceae bacterium]
MIFENRRSNVAAGHVDACDAKVVPEFCYPLPKPAVREVVMRGPLAELNVLCNRREKPNVVIVGAPGVGKSTLVAQYAFYAPEKRPIYRLDVAGLVSGTSYRGQLEERLDAVMASMEAIGGMLFVDEIHSLADIGASRGSMSALDQLKTWIVGRSVALIGATTNEEFACIARDKAFMRRLSVLRLREPSKHSVRRCCSEMVERTPALRALNLEVDKVLSWVDEKLPNGSYPDKLVDLLDYVDACFSVAPIFPSEVESKSSFAVEEIFEHYLDVYAGGMVVS